ncbi:MAG: SusD/RagB family nutrient-binding outer membrane lipoprotein [Segetibacter sp.]
MALPEAEAKNRKAINEMLTVYAYYVLITSFGDVPYSEALDIDNLQPKYDKASDIFNAIAKRLDDALASLDVAEHGYQDADLILGDDIEGWKRFGNSLKMRMGMLIADSDPAMSKTMVEQAAPNVIAVNSENIQMNFLDAPPNTNPVWEDLIQSGREDFVGAKPFIDTLRKYSDPRISEFFSTASSSGDFVGEKPGLGADPDTSSHPSDKIADPTAPYVFFSFSEMELYKAEAVERGYNVGGTAAEHYSNAVTASIEEWGGSAADAAAYLTQPGVNYLTASGTYKQKIGVQSWIALYNRGYDAWTQLRRLDAPQLALPEFGGYNPFEQGETPGLIVRLTYPVVEQNLNKASYGAASSSIGQDWKTQKLWFDKF